LDKEKTYDEKFPREGGEEGHRNPVSKRDEGNEEIQASIKKGG
jgi:hypothetical protein